VACAGGFVLVGCWWGARGVLAACSWRARGMLEYVLVYGVLVACTVLEACLRGVLGVLSCHVKQLFRTWGAGGAPGEALANTWPKFVNVWASGHL
jgi:hypothetical protein